MSRNYKSEYANYHAKLSQKKRRASRNAARRLMARKLGLSKIKGRDVDHKDRNPKNNAASNLRLQKKSQNRSRNG
ncbi:MAG: HNH endonuclease [Opitutae bacterium]|nr:HNH endonuclease [Opitutae bacterium]